MAYVPEKGDIILLNLESNTHSTPSNQRPAFVLSRQQFNKHTEVVIVAPITSQVRGIQLEVGLPTECETQGSVLVHQLRSLDFDQRQAQFIEQAPAAITEKVTQLAKVIIA